jgi:hypothetical protein
MNILSQHASSAVLPIPSGSGVADRGYFLAQVERDANTYIGAASQSREGNEPFFGVSRRRPLRDGQFSGIIMISIAPKTFSDFYRELAGDTTARCESIQSLKCPAAPFYFAVGRCL